ncbi:MAG: tryptophan-rich sensory protein [Ignavibacteria bacterium]|nr:tryptophan-rich sensory protein [Ignavibacteria bacterium]
MSNILKLILSLVICQLAGFIGAIFTMDSIPTWYAALNKPSFNPPNNVFGPVWTILYVMMGISMFLIWKEGLKNKDVKNAFIFFIIQLILNFLWSVVFFGAHSVLGGLIIIVLLWLAVLYCIISFRKISRVASILLIPYLLWITFATLLNYYILILN